MRKRPLIWLTRPQADSLHMAEALQRHGIESLVAPLLRIVPMELSVPLTVPDAILLTSRHAAQALGKIRDTWKMPPVFCVGSATAEAARAWGCETVVHGENGALALLARIHAALPKGARVLYLAGEETHVDAAALLTARGMVVEKIIAYQAEAEPSPTPELHEALARGSVDGAVFFSARTAALAKEWVHDYDLSACDAYCLSLNVAQTAALLPWRTLQVCHAPASAAMMDLIVSRRAQSVL